MIGFDEAIRLIEAWRDQYAEFDQAESSHVDEARLDSAWKEYATRLQRSYPFFHPDYAGQMLKPPHPVAVAGYLAAMMINPNNHALDGGPETSLMEKEVIRELAAMLGFPEDSALGHLTSGGTIANLEALWVSRELGSQAVIASEDAHYTHARMAGVLGMPFVSAAVNAGGKMDLDALAHLLERHGRCTVVATAGTTGLGNVDAVADIAVLRDKHDFHLHVDAAYGGFFRTLVPDSTLLSNETRRHLRAIERADSVVIDPHKHGLQPYGCGAVIFRDASIGRVYKHDSPYTYFTSSDLHLGEISLECSRAGAAAAALWLTSKIFPFTMDGMGRVLADTRMASKQFDRAIRGSEVVNMAHEPELDIVAYYCGDGADDIDMRSERAFRILMKGARPVFLSLFRIDRSRLGLEGRGNVRILRSALMKPEHRNNVGFLVDRIEKALLEAAE